MEMLRGFVRSLTPKLKDVSIEDKLRYRSAFRVAYFFSSSTLFGYVVYKYIHRLDEPQDEEHELLMGRPVIKDLSPGKSKHSNFHGCIRDLNINVEYLFYSS